MTHIVNPPCPFCKSRDISLIMEKGEEFYHCFACGARAHRGDWFQRPIEDELNQKIEKLEIEIGAKETKLRANDEVLKIRADRINSLTDQLRRYRVSAMVTDILAIWGDTEESDRKIKHLIGLFKEED